MTRLMSVKKYLEFYRAKKCFFQYCLSLSHVSNMSSPAINVNPLNKKLHLSVNSISILTQTERKNVSYLLLIDRGKIQQVLNAIKTNTGKPRFT